jgi:hypothetical protein
MNHAPQRRRWKNTATDAIAANQKCALREERLQPKKGGAIPASTKKRNTNLSLHDSKNDKNCELVVVFRRSQQQPHYLLCLTFRGAFNPGPVYPPLAQSCWRAQVVLALTTSWCGTVGTVRRRGTERTRSIHSTRLPRRLWSDTLSDTWSDSSNCSTLRSCSSCTERRSSPGSYQSWLPRRPWL